MGIGTAVGMVGRNAADIVVDTVVGIVADNVVAEAVVVEVFAGIEVVDAEIRIVDNVAATVVVVDCSIVAQVGCIAVFVVDVNCPN